MRKTIGTICGLALIMEMSLYGIGWSETTQAYREGLSKDQSQYLLDWEVSESYTEANKGCSELFDSSFPPERAPANEVLWKKIQPSSQRPFFVDLLEHFGPCTNCVAYLKTIIQCEEGALVGLEMGSDDGIKAWINGELVHANNAIRGYKRDSDKVQVTLNKGANELMLKVTQAHSGWGASARIRELDESGYAKDPVEKVEHPMLFEKSRIGDVTYEAASVFDVDNDGALDIVSGEYWFSGPDYDDRHKICDVQSQGDYFDDFSDYPMDVNGDGYLDIVTGGFWGCTLRWRENPGNLDDLWVVHDIDRCGNIETTRFWDIDGDGTVEAVPNAGGNLVAYQLIRDEQGNGTGKFQKHVIREGGGGHGLGFGDVNGDGRGDLITPFGWLVAPEKPWESEWTFHQELILGAASVPILVHDVNEDGLADLIVGEGHNYGLYWMEQKRDPLGNRLWERHEIDPSRSQYHDMALVDIDNDGRLELITGKRYRAHSGNDPGSTDPVGIYYFEIDKGAFKRATLDYGPPEKASGVGIYFWVEDIDGNGWKDIVAPGKEGLYLFKNTGQRN